MHAIPVLQRWHCFEAGGLTQTQSSVEVMKDRCNANLSDLDTTNGCLVAYDRWMRTKEDEKRSSWGRLARITAGSPSIRKVKGNLRFPLDKTYHGCPSHNNLLGVAIVNRTDYVLLTVPTQALTLQVKRVVSVWIFVLLFCNWFQESSNSKKEWIMIWFKYISRFTYWCCGLFLCRSGNVKCFKLPTCTCSQEVLPCWRK